MPIQPLSPPHDFAHCTCCSCTI